MSCTMLNMAQAKRDGNTIKCMFKLVFQNSRGQYIFGRDSNRAESKRRSISNGLEALVSAPLRLSVAAV